MIYDYTTHVSKGCYIRDAATGLPLGRVFSANDETGELIEYVLKSGTLEMEGSGDTKKPKMSTRICAWEIVTKDTGEVIARYPPRD